MTPLSDLSPLLAAALGALGGVLAGAALASLVWALAVRGIVRRSVQKAMAGAMQAHVVRHTGPADDGSAPAKRSRKRVRPDATAPAADGAFRLPEGMRPEFGTPAVFEAGHAMGRDPEDGAKWIGRKVADNLGWPVAIHYTDSKGFSEMRRVDIDALYERDGFGLRYFTGFCHLENGRRTFRTDRVNAWAVADGDEAVTELLTAPPFVDFLQERLLRQVDP